MTRAFPPTPPHLAVLLFTAALAAAPLAAQGDDVPAPTSTLLSRLQARAVTLEAARTCWSDLQGRPIEVRGQALDLLRKNLLDAQRSYDKALEALRRTAHKVVPAWQREQLGKRGAAEVDTLRGEALKISRAADLDKQRIHDEIDPRRLRLEELLLPTTEQLAAHDPAFGAQVAGLREHLALTRGWHELCCLALHELTEAPGGLRIVEKQKPLPDPAADDAVDRELTFLCLAELPMSGRDRKALDHNAATAAAIEPEEYAGTFELNRIRYVLGLPLLAVDERLGQAAKDHSADMLRLGFFSHTSPIDGKRTPGDRAARMGTSGGAENIAAGQATGRGAIGAWWYSPGHHKNMLGNHGRTGLGRADNLWTQMFGG